MSAASLVAEAERRRRRWVTVAATVPSTALVVRIAPRLPTSASITLTPEQWLVLARLDGTRMLSDVVRSLGWTSFAVCETVHGLLEAGAVEPA